MSTDLIPPKQIEQELSKIWESIEGASKTRASLLNLIFFTEKRSDPSYTRYIAKTLVEHFPSRVILITFDPNATTPLTNTRVWVEPACEGTCDIACDFIDLEVSGNDLEKIPFIILSHLLCDLPIYTVWTSDPKPKNPLFEHLKKISDRLIFDSERSTDLFRFTKELKNLHESDKIEVSDLAWARIQSWKELITSTFHAPSRLEALQNAHCIQILYNGLGPSKPIQALYLQGWLATQLKWQLLSIEEKKECWTLLYKNTSGKELKIELFAENQKHLKPGAICSIDIDTIDEQHFSMGCNLEAPQQVSMRFSTKDRCEIPLKYLFSKDLSEHALIQEIYNRQTSSHFFNLISNENQWEKFSKHGN